MSNDEYIRMLEQQNQQRRFQEANSKEFQDQKKLQEREQGFNVYMQGANKNLPQQQPGQGPRRNASNQQRGARRQWRDPSKSQERSLDGRSPINTLGQRNRAQEDQKNNEQQPRYLNPFDLSAKQSYGADQTNPNALAGAFGAQSFSNIARDKSPTDNIGQIQVRNQPRKKWGVRGQDTQQRQQIEMDDFIGEDEQAKSEHEDNDEDDYSDDDFEQNAEATQEKTAVVKPLKVIMEQTGESRMEDGNSTINDQYINDSVIEDSMNKNDNTLEDSNAHLEMFLKTATAQEMDIIRESLSNFNDVTKNFSNIKSKRNDDDNDEYIEDEFEEDIPEVNDDDGSSSEEHKFEVIRKDSLVQSKRSNAKSSRPVSAVYNLAQFKTNSGVSSGMQSQRTLQHGGNSTSILPTTTAYQPATVKKELSSKQKTIQSAWNPSGSSLQPYTDKPLGGGTSHIQPNKPSITSKPFSRPFSEVNPGKRKGPKVDFQKQFLQTEITGQNKQSFEKSQQAKYETGNLLSVRDADNIEASYGGQSVATHISKKDAELHFLIQAISQLDDSQRQDLVQVLQQKTGVNQSQHPGFQATGQSLAFGQSLAVTGMATGKPTKTKYTDMLSSADHNLKKSSSSMQVNASSQSQPRSRNELKIKVLSTHGDPYFCGLTEIELFDNLAKKIVVVPANVIVNNIGRHGGGSSSVVMSTKSLVNGVKFTNEHRNMWIGSLPAPQTPPVFLEIVIYFALNVDLSAVKIWNYNKSMRDATKGVREIEVLLNNELKFEGTVCIGKGSTKDDYSQLITIDPQAVQVPRESIAVIEEVHPKNEETIDYSTDSVNVSFNQIAIKQGKDPSPEAPKILIQEVSDYRPDYIDKNKKLGSQAASTQGNSSSKTLSGKQPVRNIDVIRQRQEISRSRSRSPINQFGQQKPLWLQDKGMNQNAASQRSLIDAGGQKLNRRQAEQRAKEQEMQKTPSSQDFYASVSKDALLNNQVPQTVQGHSNAKLDSIFTKEDNTDQNMEWFQKKPEKKFDIASEIQQASKQVQNAVDSVNKAVNQTEKNLETPNKAPFAFQPSNIKSNQSKNNIEESMDSLDFFKVTNLGRINNEYGQQSQRKQEGKKEVPTTDNKRGQWGLSNAAQLHSQNDAPAKQKVISETIISEASESSNQTGKDSISRSAYKAPRIKKNPFPEDFCMPSPATSKKSASRSSVKRERANQSKQMTDQQAKQIDEENDLLDEIDVMYPQVHNKIATKKGKDIAQKEQVDIFEEELKQLEMQDNMAMGTPIPDNIHSKSKTNEDVYKDKMAEFKKPFVIPTLPMGKILEFNILDTWGDINYLGLTGIEVFDKNGKQVKIEGASAISANPSDINLLMGQGTDPRTVDKLVDGNYFTNDDFHAWLTPFTHGEDHTITIMLPENVEISMIRIWNYNKSRIHSFRGARLMTCELDGDMIFKGEISKAPGNTQDPEACCEIILFTEDESILYAIDSNDWLNEVQLEDQNETEDGDDMKVNHEQLRPMTATKKFGQDEVEELQNALKNQNKPTSMFDERPKTKAIRREPNAPFIGYDGFDEEDNKPNNDLEDFQPQVKKAQSKPKKKSKGIKGRIIELNILESWGDLFYVGLNGVEVIDENDQSVSIDIKNVDADPRDMNSIPGHGQDHRTLDKLINRVNNTCDDRNMWLIPYNSGEDHTIRIDLGKMTQISGLRFYNYNKSPEDSLRGVKQVVIKVDGKLMTSKQGITLRKAPGFILPSNEDMRIDIGQTVNLPFSDGWKTNMIMPLQKQSVDFSRQTGLMQEFETICMPIGFTFRLNLYSTHGDNYYIGLNGIELYDQLGYIINIDPQNQVMANPAGINKLPGMESDVRSLSKLFNGKNQMFDDKNMWLAPFKFTRSHAAANSSEHSDKREPNFVAVVFDQPKAISAIRIWNYSKTASRGIHEFEIVVDDKPIYRGFAKKAPDSQQEWETQFQKDFSTVVLFSSEQRIVDRFKNQVVYDPSKQQDVLMFNERKQVNAGKVKQRPNEKFVFNEKDRPTTKYGGGFL